MADGIIFCSAQLSTGCDLTVKTGQAGGWLETGEWGLNTCVHSLISCSKAAMGIPVYQSTDDLIKSATNKFGHSHSMTGNFSKGLFVEGFACQEHVRNCIQEMDNFKIIVVLPYSNKSSIS